MPSRPSPLIRPDSSRDIELPLRVPASLGIGIEPGGGRLHLRNRLDPRFNLKTALGSSTDSTDFSDGMPPDSFLDLAERPPLEVNRTSSSTL